MRKQFLFFSLVMFLLSGCKTEAPVDTMPDQGWVESRLIGINKYLVRKNDWHINNFCRRNNWEAVRTSSGLWYRVIKDSMGNPVTQGEKISMIFEQYLINGELLRSTRQSVPVRFTLGEGKVESGLEEGLLNLSRGDSAIFIIPPHLAYGTFGDPDRNVARDAILLYSVRINDNP